MTNGDVDDDDDDDDHVAIQDQVEDVAIVTMEEELAFGGGLQRLREVQHQEVVGLPKLTF